MMPPCCAAKNALTSTPLLAPSVAGSTGTPAASAAPRAAVLWPSNPSTAGSGPTNVRPPAAHASANSAFSLRNPYPGWMRSAPELFATANTADWSR